MDAGGRAGTDVGLAPFAYGRCISVGSCRRTHRPRRPEPADMRIRNVAKAPFCLRSSPGCTTWLGMGAHGLEHEAIDPRRTWRYRGRSWGRKKVTDVMGCMEACLDTTNREDFLIVPLLLCSIGLQRSIGSDSAIQTRNKGHHWYRMPDVHVKKRLVAIEWALIEKQLTHQDLWRAGHSKMRHMTFRNVTTSTPTPECHFYT